MSCVLLWHIDTHFLYRCSHNITCKLIDHSLYICNASQLQTTTSVEKTDTTSIPPEVSTTKIVTSSTSASTPWHTSTPLVTTTTTPSPSPATTTYQPPTSTVASTTSLSNLLNQSTTTETTQLIESLENHTTTDNQSQYLSTSPTFNLTTTSTYTTSNTKTATTTSSRFTVPYNVSKTTLVATTTSTESPVTFVNTTTTTYRPTTGNPTTKMVRTTTGIPKIQTTTNSYRTTSKASVTGFGSTTTAMHIVKSTTIQKSDATATMNTKIGDSYATTSKTPYDKYFVTTTAIPIVIKSINKTNIENTTYNQNYTTTAIPIVNRTRNLTSFLKKEGRSKIENFTPQFGIIFISIILVVTFCYVIYWMRKRHAQQNKHKQQTTVLPTDEPLDPIIEDILEEQDLKNQLRINSWRMAKLHKYLKKKYPQKAVLAKSMEDNVALMEKIHIQVKNSPVQIYKKKGKKKDSIPTLTVDLIPKKDDIPTKKVDLTTALKEPEKVRHISSVAKLRIKMLPVEYEHRRKRKNFEPLKETLLPVETVPTRPRRKAPSPPKSELDVLKEKKLVSNSVFRNE